ncbi:transcriptional regulator [Prosthecomicrobium hirschii]|uniref:transcriptional regulator n=2 Tax=Prosthecodimorpha hirschii TaxID=665126 RepID=UPI00221FE108|nr:transcriptional regulator [Prosthecomicrobium hirschii]MCW1842270.1 transcriptional regulator [Prosthecomicrobium hirschii]
MLRGPRSGTLTVDYVEKARAAWGDLPDWVLALAEEATRAGAAGTAKRLQYSPSVVSQVLARKYGVHGKGGDLETFEAVVRGALMGSTVECPVLGEIGRDQCRREQSRPFTASNSTRARLRRACRTCPNCLDPNREVKS